MLAEGSYPVFWDYVALVVGVLLVGHGLRGLLLARSEAERLVAKNRRFAWAGSIPGISWWLKGWGERGSARRRIRLFGAWSLAMGVLLCFASISRL
jgi:hypothetical protein